MENKVLEKNLAYISNYDSALSNKILMTEYEKSNIGLSETLSAGYNLTLNGLELHSSENPENEADKIASSITDEENSLIIVYGLGLGYLPDSIAKRCTKSKIIIYEPNLELIKFVLSIAEIDALYRESVYLSSGRDEFSNLLKKHLTADTRLSITFLNSYNSLFNEDIMDLFQAAQDIMSEIAGNRNTYVKYASLAFANTLINLRELPKSPPIEQLKDIYKDKTALIMCAGPSLEKNIELIKQNKNKFVTFALSPTLRLLQKHDFIPDFVVSIDVIDNLKQFNNINFLDKTYYISDIYTNFYTSRLNFKNHFFFASNDNFFNYWVRDSLDLKSDIKSLGTSSYTAFKSAVLMGFSKIILVGQDLAFKDGKCYSSNSQYACLECKFSEEKQKFEIVPNDIDTFKQAYRLEWMSDEQVENGTKQFLEKLNKNLRTIKDRDGNLIPTKADYVVFIKIFEDEAKTIENIELINCSDGADIKGYKNFKLSEVTKELENIEKINLDNIKPLNNFNKLKAKIDVLYSDLLDTGLLVENFTSVTQKIIDEIEGQQQITKSTIESLKLYGEIYKEILLKFKNKDIDTLLSSFLYNIRDLLKTNYMTDKDTILNALKRILNAFIIVKQNIETYKTHLTDSKALIL